MADRQFIDGSRLPPWLRQKARELIRRDLLNGDASDGILSEEKEERGVHYFNGGTEQFISARRSPPPNERTETDFAGRVERETAPPSYAGEKNELESGNWPLLLDTLSRGARPALDGLADISPSLAFLLQLCAGAWGHMNARRLRRFALTARPVVLFPAGAAGAHIYPERPLPDRVWGIGVDPTYYI